ncbi:kelch 21 [Fusarium mexicanum]|uniref:Kelch 21 n=1 Tax=Fusarium mexicanum TaxID=751941 RepID=A0A8H5JKT6_9HYPO|nr:kelch 21 [Fusarium mexicanum]
MIPLEDRLRMQKARESGEFTDFAFVCEGQTINVHKIIICGQSTVFQKVCTGKFKVPLAALHTFMPTNEAQEAFSGIYDMNDHPLDVVNRMVEYLYTGTYEIPEDTDLFTHASMFTLADKYGIGGLQALASKKYLECLDKNCNYHDFASSISQVYSLPKETSKTLRVGALMMARKNLGTVLTAPELGMVIDEFLYDCPEFARDLLSLSLRFSLMGTCRTSGCNSRSEVPIEVIQCRCQICGKGGASAGLGLHTWSRILEYGFDVDDRDVRLGKDLGHGKRYA